MIYASSTKLLLILVSGALFACSQAAQDPKSVADKYWQNLQVGNALEAEKHVSLNSRYTFSDIQADMARITQVSNSDAEAIVTTTVTTINHENSMTQTQNFDTVLVLEQGQWKVDASRSQIPPLAETEDNAATEDDFESIDRALSDSMQKLNDALREGSKEMGDSFMHLMDELNQTMQESIEQLKQKRQENRDLPQNKQPVPDKGEGLI